jgi:CheY-like chemotaxis protein
MSTPEIQPIHVLIVEDDDVEIMAIRRALRSARSPHTLSIAHDGVEALAALRGDGHVAPETPALIFMDINMPRMNGFELLEQLRNDPAHAQTDVVVVTTSNAEEDHRAAWRGRVAGYIVKSSYDGSFEAFAREIDTFLSKSAAAQQSLRVAQRPEPSSERSAR